MRRGVLVALLLAVATPATAQAPAPPPSCEQQRDHLQQVVRLLADSRGDAEWQLAAARAEILRLRAELQALRAAPSGPKP